MSVRAFLALLTLASSLSLAAAQPKIPPGEMAGRERERFIESPAERFMKPGPYLAPPVVDQPPEPLKRGFRKAARQRKHR